MECRFIIASTILASVIAITVEVFSPISPDPLQLPPSSPVLAPNKRLHEVIKLGEGILNNPEDVCMDQKGMLYTATRDGWIRRMHTNGTWERWKMIHNRDTLLGLIVTRDGDLIVCDADEGLIKVSEDGEVTVLASHFNGKSIRFADDVVEAQDGSLYFSVASTKFPLHNWHLDMLEAKPHGQLLKYDPSTNETSLVLDGLGLANGVAISSDQEFLVVCETWNGIRSKCSRDGNNAKSYLLGTCSGCFCKRYRCLKYWLKKEMKGIVEIFIDNLPGAPDNIKLAPDGSFWVALIQLTKGGMEFVHSSKAIKHLLAMFPKLYEQVKGVHRSAMVMNVGSDGKMIKRLDDPNGHVMSFVTSVLEFEGNLYFGSLNTDFIGKLPM